MATYLCSSSDDSIEIEADSAREAAQSYVDGGDYGDDASTQWVTVYVQEIGEELLDGDGPRIDGDRERIKIAIEPTEPDCIDGDGHDWQSPIEIVGGCDSNPGVYGHGGGIVVHEVCVRCGCGQHTDTWAQDLTDGEQGLRSVSCEPGEYSEAIDEYLRSLDVGDLDQSDSREGEGWSTFVAEGPWGRWASVSVDDRDAVDVEWHATESDAREQSRRDAENLGESRPRS